MMEAAEAADECLAADELEHEFAGRDAVARIEFGHLGVGEKLRVGLRNQARDTTQIRRKPDAAGRLLDDPERVETDIVAHVAFDPGCAGLADAGQSETQSEQHLARRRGTDKAGKHVALLENERATLAAPDAIVGQGQEIIALAHGAMDPGIARRHPLEGRHAAFVLQQREALAGVGDDPLAVFNHSEWRLVDALRFLEERDA